MKVTFSAVDNPEFPLFLHALGLLPGGPVEIEEIVGRTDLSLDGSKDKLSVIRALAGASKVYQAAPAGSLESLLEEQWLGFSLDVVASELAVTHDLEGLVFGPLQAGLERKTFLSGSLCHPSLADWYLFALLHSRIAAMVPMNVGKFYRVVRWAGHLSSLVPKPSPAGFKPIDIDGICRSIEDLSISKPKESKDAKDVKTKKADTKKEKKAQPAKPEPVKVAEHPLARVDLKVGKIIAVERHPAADRLFVETVDFGESTGPRTVVSGLVEHVPMEDLQDRLGMFVCNLKPASLCKVMSTAMLLVSKDAAGLEPLLVPEGSQPGDLVTVDGVLPQPDPVIKPKEDTWEKVRVDLKTVDGIAYYQDKPLVIIGKDGQSRPGNVTSVKAPTGEIS